MDPTSEIVLDGCASDVSLRVIDEQLVEFADRVERTRKGRVWDIWVQDRPIHIAVLKTEPEISLAAGCNTPLDYSMLQQLSSSLAKLLNGIATDPVK